MLIGEERPYWAMLVVFNCDQRAKVAADHGLNPKSDAVMCGADAEKIALKRVQAQIREFPGYAQVHRVAILAKPWTIENGLLTPTMKVKRAKVVEAHRPEYEKLYAGH